MNGGTYMFLKFTEKFGKPVCVALYAAFSALAAKRIWQPLAALGLMHFCEFFAAAIRVAKDNSIDMFTAFVNCLAFGFTWWLPIKKHGKTSDK